MLIGGFNRHNRGEVRAERFKTAHLYATLRWWRWNVAPREE
jgi:hypothetical protein